MLQVGPYKITGVHTADEGGAGPWVYFYAEGVGQIDDPGIVAEVQQFVDTHGGLPEDVALSWFSTNEEIEEARRTPAHCGPFGYTPLGERVIGRFVDESGRLTEYWPDTGDDSNGPATTDDDDGPSDR